MKTLSTNQQKQITGGSWKLAFYDRNGYPCGAFIGPDKGYFERNAESLKSCSDWTYVIVEV